MADLVSLPIDELASLPDFMVPESRRQDLSNYLARLSEEAACLRVPDRGPALVSEWIERRRELARAIFREHCEGRALPLPQWSWAMGNEVTRNEGTSTQSCWSGSPVNPGGKALPIEGEASYGSVGASEPSQQRRSAAEQEVRIFNGPRGGKYTKQITKKDGRPYRRYL